jgi:serine protease AprX
MRIAAAGFVASLVIAGLSAGTSLASDHIAKGVSWDGYEPGRGVSWDPARTPGASWSKPMVVAGGVVAPAYDPLSDVGSLQNTATIIGAPAYWNAGFDGTGIGVALIDTGVSPVGPLSGKVVNGPDLSFDSQAPNLRYLDGNGHGTFTAGIINGMAPGARILSVKVGNYKGQVDVSQVIAAIDWVVQHRNDNGMNIRVLNLSYGTNSSQDYRVDPLAFAVEQAWKAGIVVVASSGNAGFVHGGSLMDPAFDPFAIAVGAADTQGTVSKSDDTVAAFSSNGDIGSEKRPIDVIAPGTHVVSLRDPGSYIDQNYSSTGAVTASLFRGSGTSEATALVSGAVALILQQHPSITPDQVKKLLSTSADRLRGFSWQLQGTGEIDLTNTLAEKVRNGSQSWEPGDGVGSLEGSRGDVHVSVDGVFLTGEKDIFGAAFDAPAMASFEAAEDSWAGDVWNGNSWSGNSWSGNSWSGNSWSGNSWSGNSWSGNSWSTVCWS